MDDSGDAASQGDQKAELTPFFEPPVEAEAGALYPEEAGAL